MACLTGEELAALALGLDEATHWAAHAHECPACRAKLAALTRLTEQLSAAHAQLDRTHATSRARLLASLPSADVSGRLARKRTWLARMLQGSTLRQRLAAGSLGLTTAAGLLLLLVALNTAEQLSAMERMAKQLREVTSFSFELEETSDRVTGENRRRIQRNDTNYWRAPTFWRSTTQMVKLPLPLAIGDANGELLHRIEEIYTPGQRGILIDHKNRTFFRTTEMETDSFPDYSPVNWVQRMSKGSVKVLDDLGTKELHGKMAHGYVVSLGHPDPNSGQNAAHLWVDTETHLPIEFRYEDSGKTETVDRWTNVMRIFNCRWNIELDPEFFEPIEPVGYDDTSWPADDDDMALKQIVDALRLYAQLSGGHYPRMTEFHGQEVHEEMRKLAASNAKLKSEPDGERVLQRIKQAKPGLDWITQTLRNKYHTGYYGAEVGPNDRDKVLMWWPVDIEDSYRVIYGDLRSEILPLAEWTKLVPADMAESHTPVEYTKPDEER